MAGEFFVQSFRRNGTKSRNIERAFESAHSRFDCRALEFTRADSWFSLINPMQTAFYQSEADQPHPGRARLIIKAHPEVRQ
jgi:hypothetical protein